MSFTGLVREFAIETIKVKYQDEQKQYKTQYNLDRENNINETEEKNDRTETTLGKIERDNKERRQTKGQ